MSLSDNKVEKMLEKRKRILEQSVILFSEHGYNDTTISKVAKASGVSFGSIFTYFKNKDDLFNCAVIEPLEELRLAFNFSTDTNDPLAEIEQMVTNHVKLFANSGTYLRLVVQVVGQYNRFPKEFTELDSFHNEARNKVVKLVLKGQELSQLRKLNPMDVATSYISFLMGLRLTLADAPEHEMWDDFIPFAIQLFGPKDVNL